MKIENFESESIQRRRHALLNVKMAPSLLRSVILLLTIWLTCAAGIATPPRGNSVLVIGENEDVETTHSRLIQALKVAGRQVTFVSATSTGKTAGKGIALQSEGEYLYDGVVLLAPYSTTLSSKLPASKLVSYLDSGRDVFITSGTAGYSAYIDKVAEAFGVDLDDKDNRMIDFQNILHVENTNDSSSPWIKPGGWAKHVFGEKMDGDIGFSGVGATLFKDNELVNPIVWGSGSSFGRRRAKTGAATTMTKVPRVAGAGAVLGAAVGTTMGSRGTWFGSFEALSDEMFDQLGKTHESAMTHMVLWSISEYGVLRLGPAMHGRVSDGGVSNAAVVDQTWSSPSEYRVKDKIELAFAVHVWDGGLAQWVTYECDDIQVEFVMMNPWVRTRLSLNDAQSAIYKTHVQVPDQIGVYKVKIEYVRRGVSPILFEHVIPVRPFLHNEYERFIQMASPYYVASFSMIFSVFLVGLVVLYGGDNEAEGMTDVREKTE